MQQKDTKAMCQEISFYLWGATKEPHIHILRDDELVLSLAPANAKVQVEGERYHMSCRMSGENSRRGRKVTKNLEKITACRTYLF